MQNYKPESAISLIELAERIYILYIPALRMLRVLDILLTTRWVSISVNIVCYSVVERTHLCIFIFLARLGVP